MNHRSTLLGLGLSLTLACGDKKTTPGEDTGAPPDDTGAPPDTGTDTDEPEIPTEKCNGKDDNDNGIIDEGMLGYFPDETGMAMWTVGPGVATTIISADEWSNGDIDEVTTKHFDTEGRIVEASTTYADSEAGSTTTYAYNEDGGLLLRQDISAAGEVMLEFRNTWEDGLHIAAEWYSVTDGEYDLILAYYFTYDDNGYHLSRTEDSDGDGEVNNIMWTEWSSDYLVRTDSYYVTRLDTYYQTMRTTYSATGKTLKIEMDGDNDGVYDWINTLTYDDDDLLQFTEISYSDGEVASRDIYEYDAAGRLIWLHTDNPAYGAVEGSSGFVWEGDSLIESMEDIDGEGAMEMWTQWRYTLDDAGNHVTGIDDPDDHSSDGTHTWTYEYICH